MTQALKDKNVVANFLIVLTCAKAYAQHETSCELRDANKAMRKFSLFLSRLIRYFTKF
jgi:hypothetical protein